MKEHVEAVTKSLQSRNAILELVLKGFNSASIKVYRAKLSFLSLVFIVRPRFNAL